MAQILQFFKKVQLGDLFWVIIFQVMACDSVSEPLIGMRMLGDNEPLPLGDIYGIYVTPKTQENVALPIDHSIPSDGKLFLACVSDSENPSVPTGSGHVFMIAKILGCDSTESFFEKVYSGELTNGRGRFASTFFINQPHRALNVPYIGKTASAHTLHLSAWHTFKGFGQLNPDAYKNWLLDSLTSRLFVDHEDYFDFRDEHQAQELERIYLCNSNLPENCLNPNEFLTPLHGITPINYRSTIIKKIAQRNSGAQLLLHITMEDGLFRWNRYLNDNLNNSNILYSYLRDELIPDLANSLLPTINAININNGFSGNVIVSNLLSRPDDPVK